MCRYSMKRKYHIHLVHTDFGAKQVLFGVKTSTFPEIFCFTPFGIPFVFCSLFHTMICVSHNTRWFTPSCMVSHLIFVFTPKEHVLHYTWWITSSSMFHTIILYSRQKSMVHTKTVQFTPKLWRFIPFIERFHNRNKLIHTESEPFTQHDKKFTLVLASHYGNGTSQQWRPHKWQSHPEETGTLSRSLKKALHLSRRVSSPGQTRHLCAFLLHSPHPPDPLHADPWWYPCVKTCSSENQSDTCAWRRAPTTSPWFPEEA